MNANARFLNEARQLEAGWSKSGLLKGVDAKGVKAETAVMLECQRLHNETGTWDCCEECQERERQEKEQQ